MEILAQFSAAWYEMGITTGDASGRQVGFAGRCPFVPHVFVSALSVPPVREPSLCTEGPQPLAPCQTQSCSLLFTGPLLPGALFLTFTAQHVSKETFITLYLLLLYINV